MREQYRENGKSDGFMWFMLDPEFIPGRLGLRQEYTMDGTQSPLKGITSTHTLRGNLKYPIHTPA